MPDFLNCTYTWLSHPTKRWCCLWDFFWANYDVTYGRKMFTLQIHSTPGLYLLKYPNKMLARNETNTAMSFFFSNCMPAETFHEAYSFYFKRVFWYWSKIDLTMKNSKLPSNLYSYSTTICTYMLIYIFCILYVTHCSCFWNELNFLVPFGRERSFSMQWSS